MENTLQELEAEKTNLISLKLFWQLPEEVAERKINNINEKIEEIKNKTDNLLTK
jgi:hypothetical protein